MRVSIALWTVVAVVVFTLLPGGAALAAGVTLEDRAYVDTDNGGVDHNFKVIIPDGEMAWEFSYSPAVDGFDAGWRWPKQELGTSKLQPRLILGVRDGDLSQVKAVTVLTGKIDVDRSYCWFASNKFSKKSKAGFYHELQVDFYGDKDVALSAIATFGGAYADNTGINVTLGPALTYKGKGWDVQLYYGMACNQHSGDTAWVLTHLQLPD